MNYLAVRSILGVLWGAIVLGVIILTTSGVSDGAIGAVAIAFIGICAAAIVTIRRTYRDLLLKNARPSRTVRIVGVILAIFGALMLLRKWLDLVIGVALIGQDPLSLQSYQMLIYTVAPGMLFLFGGFSIARSNAPTASATKPSHES